MPTPLPLNLLPLATREVARSIGIDQVNSMANAVLFAAAQQIGGEVLAAALQVDPSSSAPELTDKLMAAVEAGEGATDDRDDSADDSPRPQPDPEPRGSC